MTVEEMRTYSKNYYNENKEYFQEYHKWYGKPYREAKKRNCIYRLMNKKGQVLYYGSSTSFNVRECMHRNSSSNLHMTPEKWCELECDHWEVTYLDIDMTRTELYFVEDLFMCECKDDTLINDRRAYDDKTGEITEDRKLELQELSSALTFSVYEK